MNDLFIQGLTIDWNRVRPYNYVRQIPAISGIDTFTFHKPITFFVGENGSGKSTLLEAIAVAYGFNAEGGTKNYSCLTDYQIITHLLRATLKTVARYFYTLKSEKGGTLCQAKPKNISPLPSARRTA